MTAYTDFHYTPTGTGVISGKEVLEQTEDGINDLGQYVQNNVSGAIDTANQALTIAQTANANATTALNTANSLSAAITTANQTANNALTTAQSAQNTANSASSLANTANNNANTALNAANTATSNVATLTSSVNALGNRMTAAENNISANAGNITTLQNNLATTNANVTAAANAASAAQATATSAQNTATMARQQAYVLRYSSSSVTDNSTIAYSTLDNTDNIKVSDKIIDSDGKIFSIVSVDSANQTVTVGSALIDLANDSDVVHVKGSDDIIDSKTFISLYTQSSSPSLWMKNTSFTMGTAPTTNRYSGIWVQDNNGTDTAYIVHQANKNNSQNLKFSVSNTDGITVYQNALTFQGRLDGTFNFYSDNPANLGTSTNKWKLFNGINPGSLSFPDLSSGLDISGYITVNGGNKESLYTPSVNGWISVALTRSGGTNMAVMLKQGNFASSGHNIQQENGTTTCNAMLPVVGGVQVSINNALADGIYFAYFYPCLGNV